MSFQLADQQQAEKEKQKSELLQKQLDEQGKQVAEKQKIVKADLDQVEPAVIEAQNGQLFVIESVKYVGWVL